MEINDLTNRTRATMTRRRGGVGRPSIDIAKLAEALATPGIDVRSWIATGTVGVRLEDGTFVTDDPEAIYADRLGAVVDVRIEPDEEIVTFRWSGLGCGRYGFMLYPLRPGDEVACFFPGGDRNHAGAAIFAVQSNQTAQIPSDWNNDRVLFDLNVPLEIRGPAVRITSPNLVLNGRGVSRTPEGI